MVENVFKDADNINTALNTLFQRMNENVGIWDFRTVASPDNPSQLKIVDMNTTKYSVKDLIDNPSSLSDD